MTRTELLGTLAMAPGGRGAHLDDAAGAVWPGKRGRRGQGDGSFVPTGCDLGFIGRGTRAAHLVCHAGNGGVKAVLLEAALPNGDDLPAVAGKLLAVALVSSAVTGKLGGPELDVRLWCGEGAVGAAVPEAAVDKDGDLAAGIANVWLAGSGPPVQAIPGQARGAQGRTHPELGLGVL